MAYGQTTAAAPAAPTARQLELAQQILDATGVEKNYDEMMRNLFGQIAERTAEMMPNRTAAATEATKVMNDAILAAIAKTKPRIMEISVEVYAQTFTEAEMEGMLVFYRSPTGQAMTAKMPQLTRNIGAATSKVMPEMMEVMSKELGQRLPALQAPPKAMPKTPKT